MCGIFDIFVVVVGFWCICPSLIWIPFQNNSFTRRLGLHINWTELMKRTHRKPHQTYWYHSYTFLWRPDSIHSSSFHNSEMHIYSEMSKINPYKYTKYLQTNEKNMNESSVNISREMKRSRRQFESIFSLRCRLSKIIAFYFNVFFPLAFAFFVDKYIFRKKFYGKKCDRNANDSTKWTNDTFN